MPESVVGEAGRLDAVLARLLGVARADVQRAIDAGDVLVDGGARPKSFRLVGGEIIEVTLVVGGGLEAEGPPVPVRYEDADVLVVAKPAGIVTHPTEGRRTGTLVNRLLGMGVPLAPAGGPFRPGIVHRLDVGTSGLLVVAKTDAAFEGLRAMFRAHGVYRGYLALVRGSPVHEGFTVDAPLGRRAARIVVDRLEGRGATTGIEVLERLERCTLVRATPETGRTHQIRVHLAAVGHPILGDASYGGGGDLARALGLTRPFLHAGWIGFEHPIDGRRIDLEEALPGDLTDALILARSDLRP